jgi:hypothetical protein
MEFGFGDIHTEIPHDRKPIEKKTITPTDLVHAGFAPWLPFSVGAGVAGENRGLDLRDKVYAFRMGSSFLRLK